MYEYVAIVLLGLINIALKKVCNAIESTAPTRILDSVVAFGLYLIIGALLCTGIWFGFAAADYFGVFKVTEALSEGAYLTDGLIRFAQVVLDGLLAPYMF